MTRHRLSRPRTPPPTAADREFSADLATARQQGWKITVVAKHAVKLTHPSGRELLVEGGASGAWTRRSLRNAMRLVKEGEQCRD